MAIVEAYKMQLEDDGDGRRLLVEGPHTLRMFRPDTAKTAVPILLSGNICWVIAGDVGAVKAALEAQGVGERDR